MTNDTAYQSGGTPEMLNQEHLTAAVQKELGDAGGYLDMKYRDWCLEQPDEVYKHMFIYIYTAVINH